MVQHKGDEREPSIANDEVKLESYEENLNGLNQPSESEDSEDDDWVDHLLMLPSLDAHTADRNKSLVSRTLLEFCAAIENRKEYQKLKQELMLNTVPQLITEPTTPITDHEQKEIVVKEESPVFIIPLKIIQVKSENGFSEEPEIRRQSIRLNKAKFVPEHEPSLNDQFFVCRRCTIFFRTRKLRKLHNMTHHRRKVNEQFTDVPQKQRRRSSVNKEPLICDLCEKIFKLKALLRSHMNIHMTEPQFFCSLCPYASKRNNDLKKHIEMHHNPDRIVTKQIRRRKCEKCEAIVIGKKALRLHMRENHPPEKKTKKVRIIKRTCEKCDEVFEGMKAYRLHLKQKHSETNDIRCETCHRKFKTNFRLKKHQAKYTGIDCKTYFRQNGEKTSFDCQHCEKKFLLKSHLSLHMKKHSNLTCDKCNLCFKNKFNLKWHEFSHLEIDPKCSNCAVNFTSEQKFAIHLKKKICISNEIVNGSSH